VPGQKSGLKIYGEQRGCALAISMGMGAWTCWSRKMERKQNSITNTGAKPGLRVRLKGSLGILPPSGQPARGSASGLGAAARFTPARVYWSQDSAVQVFSASQSPAQLSVRWPGGKETISKIQQGAREISVDASGKVEVVAPATK